MGLRERQKAGRRVAILEAAQRLFEEKGYEGTTVQEIAAVAELTVPTVYRYFRSKNEFLMGLYDRLVADVEEEGRRVLAALPDDPVEAIRAMIEAQADLRAPDTASNLRHWRTIVPVAIQQPGLFGSSYYAQDQRLMRQLQQLCSDLKARGQLRRDADPTAFAELLNTLGRGIFRMRLGSERNPGKISELIQSLAESVYHSYH